MAEERRHTTSKWYQNADSQIFKLYRLNRLRVIDELSKVIVGSGYVRLGIACGAESVESVLYYHPYYYSRVLVIETMLELHLLRNRTKLWLRPCVL